jgi:hypothetical protein
MSKEKAELRETVQGHGSSVPSHGAAEIGAGAENTADGPSCAQFVADAPKNVQGHGPQAIDFFGGCTCKKGIHGRITPTQKAESCPVHGYIGKNGRHVKPGPAKES